MNDDRTVIFERIRRALAPLPKRTPLPDWEDSLVVSHAHPEFKTDWELFCHKLKALHGVPLEGLDALAAWLKEAGQTVGYCDPSLLEKLRACPGFSGITLETTFDRSRMDDYTFGITPAAGAIAETGTVILKDRQTASRLGALAPWTHIAVLEEMDLYPDIPSAIRHLGDDPCIVWATGPSKTADVEGILIEGVHGPGIQACCLLG